jgi:integrase
MKKRKSANYLSAKLYMPNKGQCFVYYSVRNIVDNSMTRFKIYENLNKKNQTNEQKIKIANEIITKINEKLSAGWNPFIENSVFFNLKSRQNQFNFSDSSVNYFFEKWLIDHKKDLRHKSYKTYESKIRIFCQFLQEKNIKNIAALNSNIMVQFFSKLKIEKSNATYNSYHTILKMILNNDALFENVKKLKKESKPAARLTDADLTTLFTYLKNHDPLLLMFCRFIFYCFIRPHSELRHLKRHWIDFNKLSVLIPANISKNHRAAILPIPLNDFAAQIEEIKDRHPDDYIFSENSNQLCSANYWARRFNQVKDKINLPSNVTLYSLKHTGAIKLLETGASVMDIKMQMRHHSLDQTYEYLRQMQVLENDRIRFNNLNF